MLLIFKINVFIKNCEELVIYYTMKTFEFIKIYEVNRPLYYSEFSMHNYDEE